MATDKLESDVAAFLVRLGYGNGAFQIEPLSASGNNRVFTLLIGAEKRVLKWYFHDATDSRDRLGAEYAFLEHAWKVGLRCIPEPLGKDNNSHLALYEFVEGKQLRHADIDEALVRQAAEFLAQLNASQSRSTANTLSNASEACFSVEDHFVMVDNRLARFDGIQVTNDLDQEAVAFVALLNDYWKQTKSQLTQRCSSIGLALGTVLQVSDRCISPSDFGFHNALKRPDGRLCFIDFEYAGWDDPAKALGDFFAHPGVPVPHEYWDAFSEEFAASFDEPNVIESRARLLEPIFQIKWCCIILNEFLPADARRRNFANPAKDDNQRKRHQLDKAKYYFKRLQH